MRFLLAFFFFVMYAGDDLGINVSFAPGLSLKNLLLYAIVAGIAINTAIARNRKFELPSVLIPWGALILYAIVTWIAVTYILAYPGYDAMETLIRLKFGMLDQFLTFLVFFYGVVYFEDAYSLLRMIVWIAIIGNVVTILDTFNIPNLDLVGASQEVGEEGRVQGFVGQANSYGSFLVLILPVSVALYLSESGKVRLLAGICLIATAFTLVLTGSRGAYVGLVAGATFAAISLRQFISARVVVRTGLISVSVVAIVLTIAFATGYEDLFIERFSRFTGDPHVATSGRSTIWAHAIASMVEHPLSFFTGYGVEAYENTKGVRRATHNMYLNYLYNLGAIGLILFVTVFVRILATARAAIKVAAAEYRPFFMALVFGLIGFMITLLFFEYHRSGYLLSAYLGVVMRMAMEVKSSAVPGTFQP